MIIKTKSIVVFDLDDTLYNEIDFLKSAFNDISLLISEETQQEKLNIFNDMLKFYAERENVFKLIIEKYNTSFSIDQLLQLYRNHKPNLLVYDLTKRTLEAFKNKNTYMGIITDGRSVQQRNKLKALKIENYFTDIIISEEFGSEKPDSKNYEYFNSKFGIANYYYVGDNVSKDFISPNRLDWITICLLDNGFNVHKQNFNLSDEYLPKHRIRHLDELLHIIE